LSSCWKSRFVFRWQNFATWQETKNGTLICTKDFYEKNGPNSPFLWDCSFHIPFLRILKIIGMRKYNALPYSKESEKE
jgi:hypothetical protein